MDQCQTQFSPLENHVVEKPRYDFGDEQNSTTGFQAATSHTGFPSFSVKRAFPNVKHLTPADVLTPRPSKRKSNQAGLGTNPNATMGSQVLKAKPIEGMACSTLLGSVNEFVELVKSSPFPLEAEKRLQELLEEKEINLPCPKVTLYAFSARHEQAMLEALRLNTVYEISVKRLFTSGATGTEGGQGRQQQQDSQHKAGLQECTPTIKSFKFPLHHGITTQSHLKKRFNRSTPLKVFRLFPKLPMELRHMIWSLALPGPRTVTLHASKSISLFQPGCAIPGIIQACRESRKISTRLLKPRFAATYLNTCYVYTNLEVDTILLDLKSAGRLAAVRDAGIEEDRKAVKHLQIPLVIDYHDEMFCNAVGSLVCTAPVTVWPGVETWAFQSLNATPSDEQSLSHLRIERPKDLVSAERMVKQVVLSIRAALKLSKKEKRGFATGLIVRYAGKNDELHSPTLLQSISV